jgi:hypothetical protein
MTDNDFQMNSPNQEDIVGKKRVQFIDYLPCATPVTFFSSFSCHIKIYIWIYNQIAFSESALNVDTFKKKVCSNIPIFSHIKHYFRFWKIQDGRQKTRWPTTQDGRQLNISSKLLNS